MEEHSKAAKGPMFLEIVDYKLKNRIYHKVEHAIKDFRRVIHSARLYHQVYNDEICLGPSPFMFLYWMNQQVELIKCLCDNLRFFFYHSKTTKE